MPRYIANKIMQKNTPEKLFLENPAQFSTVTADCFTPKGSTSDSIKSWGQEPWPKDLEKFKITSELSRKTSKTDTIGKIETSGFVQNSNSDRYFETPYSKIYARKLQKTQDISINPIKHSAWIRSGVTAKDQNQVNAKQGHMNRFLSQKWFADHPVLIESRPFKAWF